MCLLVRVLDFRGVSVAIPLRLFAAGPCLALSSPARGRDLLPTVMVSWRILITPLSFAVAINPSVLGDRSPHCLDRTNKVALLLELGSFPGVSEAAAAAPGLPSERYCPKRLLLPLLMSMLLMVLLPPSRSDCSCCLLLMHPLQGEGVVPPGVPAPAWVDIACRLVLGSSFPVASRTKLFRRSPENNTNYNTILLSFAIESSEQSKSPAPGSEPWQARSRLFGASQGVFERKRTMMWTKLCRNTREKR